jgi:hypothetical protein
VIDTTANLVISKSNEVFLKINTEPHIEYELRDHFKFEVPNAKFMPQYRGRNWNGEIHLFDMRSKQIYVGLLDKIVNFCEQYGYSYKFEDNKFYGAPYEENDTSQWRVSKIICILFVLTLPVNTKLREYTVL